MNSDKNKQRDLILLEEFKNEFPKSKQSDWFTVYMNYEEFRDWNFDVLNKIYFDDDEFFYTNLEDKVDRMLAIIDSK
jgi:hypothetical protein